MDYRYAPSYTRDLSSAGRASALQAEGHRFEPYRSHSSIIYWWCVRRCGGIGRRKGLKIPHVYSTQYRVNPWFYWVSRKSKILICSSIGNIPPNIRENPSDWCIYTPCWCGGIGRRKGLKIPRGQLRAGSSPATSSMAWGRIPVSLLLFGVLFLCNLL